MKALKKILVITLALLILLTSFASCNKGNGGNSGDGGNGGGGSEKPAVTSDSLYVKKVENLSDDFIMGMDASCVPSLEASGVKYYDYDGTEKDVYEILSNNGINYIRVRVWNDPFDKDGNGYGGGNCDIENAIEVGKRATKYGMKLLVNFHYSDFWADPAKQMVPKAWKGMTAAEMSEALYQYTKESLQKLVDAGVDIGMVQVGNETNGYMCGFRSWGDIAKLMKAGSKAVREVCPNSLVAVHFANPEKVTNYKQYAYYLASQQVDYDVFASSYYPFWHGTLENLATVLNNVAAETGKKTMIAETSYAYTAENTDMYNNTIGEGGGIVKDYPFTIQGQANLVRNVIDTAANDIPSCLGVFYWEGTWISVGNESWEENSALWEQHGSGWASSYAAGYDPNDAGQYYGGCSVENQAFFDANGNVLESLKIFDLVKNGNVIENKADAIEDVELIIDLNGDIVLPDKVNAVMLDNSKQELQVEWYNVDYEAMKNGGAQKYTIKGKAGGMEATCYVSMVEYNFLKNWSFEDDANGTAVPTGWSVNVIKTFDELHVENKVTDAQTGNNNFHFWGAGTDSVEFSLEQEVSGLKAGKYNFTVSIMGGDGGETDIYSYVKINGEIVATADLQITSYNEWHTATVSNVECGEGDVLTVGVYVKCQGANNGAWGKIDDAMLNSVSE